MSELYPLPRRRLTALLITLAILCKMVASAADLDVVLAAVTAEEAAPRKQASMTYKISDREVYYGIERVLPDRFRILAYSGQAKKTIVGIGKTIYVLMPGKEWKTIPSTPSPIAPISLTDLFRNRLENLKELPSVVGEDGSAQRAFSGRISWSSGVKGNLNKGDITIFIETSSGLLRRMSFKGLCGEQPCSFDHAIRYDPSVDIEAPL